MIGEAADDAGEIGFRIEPVEIGGFDNRAPHRRAVAASVRTDEEAVLAAEGHGLNGAFGRVVGHLRPDGRS